MSLVALPNGPWPSIRYSNAISTGVGIALVAIGVAAALAAGVRFYTVAAAGAADNAEAARPIGYRYQ